MDWKRNKIRLLAISIIAVIVTSCSVSYKFNGASIDYNTTKTIQIADFPIRSSYVWGPMASIFNKKPISWLMEGSSLKKLSAKAYKSGESACSISVPLEAINFKFSAMKELV